MILNLVQIKSIIIDRPNLSLINAGTDYNTKMRMHLYGSGLGDQMTKIEGYEGENLQKLRAKYSRSNKDLFSRLGRPIDKVFSARGGSVYYNLTEDQKKSAVNLSLNIRNGYSIRKWVESYWKPHMLDDPFGLMFLEILPIQEAKKAKNEGKSFVYPTYKSISAVYDYQPKGSELDYIVFAVSTGEKKAAGYKGDEQIYRVVDDSFDYWILREEEEVRIIADHTYPNYFGQVPGIINSDISSPENDGYFLSFFDEVIELANHFLLKGSIRLTHDFLHGYPKYWEYADACDVCNGTKYKDGEPCKTCNGSGKKIMLKVSDAKLLEYPSTKDDPLVAPNVAGYVSPDKTYYEVSTTDLQLLEDAMNITTWGTGSKVKTTPMQINQKGDTKTATEVMGDIKPESDRLNIISEMAEKRHKFLLDNVIRLNLSLPGYAGASVNYGRRYMIEGPDEVWNKYSDARTKGGAVSVLDDLLMEYYETKFQTDPVKLAIQIKLMKVEPFVHLTSQQTDLSASITAEDKAAKTYFGEWLSTLNEAMILSFTPELLREQLIGYAAAKAQAVQDAKAADVALQNSFKQQPAAA